MTSSIRQNGAQRAALELLDRRLKACRNRSWAFYDYSPNRSAKWCSMQLCGNRRKTRSCHRRRRGGTKPGDQEERR